MNQFSRWLPSRRQLQLHLGRLVDTIEGMVQRLRESIARTVGEVVANAVHELTQRLGRSPHHRSDPSRWHNRGGGWDEPEYSEWEDEPEYENHRYHDDDSSATREDTAQPSRWRHALSVGCQTAAWWLRRHIGRYPVLASTGLGLTAALVSYGAGPIVGVGLAGITGALLHLLGLSDAMEASANALGR